MRILMIVAVVCFAIALLEQIAVINGNALAWAFAGLLAWAVDVMLGSHAPVIPR